MVKRASSRTHLPANQHPPTLRAVTGRRDHAIAFVLSAAVLLLIVLAGLSLSRDLLPLGGEDVCLTQGATKGIQGLGGSSIASHQTLWPPGVECTYERADGSVATAHLGSGPWFQWTLGILAASGLAAMLALFWRRLRRRGFVSSSASSG